MKKIISAFIILITLLSVVCYADTSDKITVLLDEAELSFDVEPIMENNRVLVPFRGILEALGCSVKYTVSGEQEIITAHKGSDSIVLTIGEPKMYASTREVPLDEITLDVGARIINGRTLVPLRAVSSAFGADVDWINETKTVVITSVQGDHKISAVTKNREIKSSNDTLLINLTASFPVIENKGNNTFIEDINKDYKEEAESFPENIAEYEQAALEHYSTMIEGGNFMPYEYTYTYTVDYDKSELLSITSYSYYYSGGAHGMTINNSKTFDLTNQKELVLTDILNGTEAEIDELIINEFSEYFKEETSEDFLTEWGNSLKENVKDIKFRLTNEGLSLYFDVYTVAPYAAGTPEVIIPYNDVLFKINI